MANFWESDQIANPFDVALSLEGITGKKADIARSIYQQESNSGKNTTTSNAGAVGGMQIIPATFNRMADKGWDINDPIHNARAGLRYINKLYDLAEGDPALVGAGYYGGEGAIPKAKAGIPISDPRNPNAPNTIQYGQQVASRLPKTSIVDAIISPAQAGTMPQENWWEKDQLVNQDSFGAEDKPANLTYGQVAAEALRNVPSSAKKFGSELWHAVTNPVQTLESTAKLGAGALYHASPEFIQKFWRELPGDPQKMQEVIDMASAAGGEIKKRWGSVEDAKRTLAYDPVGALSDVSMILSGGSTAAAKVPVVGSKFAPLLAKTATVIDPVNIATQAVTKPVKLAGALTSEVTGLTSGAGSQAVKEAYKAGAEGGTKGEAFVSQLRKLEPVENVVNEARGALDVIKKERSDVYKSGMVDIKNDATILDFAPIDKAIADAKSKGQFHGKVIDKSAADAWKSIDEIVTDWKNSDPATYHTPEGLDNLKRAVNDVRYKTDPGTAARRAVDEVYHSIKGQIEGQAPTYSKVMKNYESASNLIREIEHSLALKKAGKEAEINIDSAVRKLQSIMRNNANTNYGRRVELGRELEKAGAENLFPQLSGQMLSSWTPRGIQGATSALAGMSALATNPWYLPGLAVASPRAIGEAAYLTGKAGGKVEKMADLLKKYTGPNAEKRAFIRNVLSNLGSQENQ